MALVAKIEQASRRRDQDVYAPRQGFHLTSLIDAAEDHGGAQREIASICLEALADLAGELAGGRQDQGVR